MRLIAVVVACLAFPAAAQSWPSVSSDLPRTGGGEDDVAVVVGVAHYYALPAIPGADDNARDWYQYLVRVRGMAPDRVTFLVDADATRERFQKALEAAAAAAHPNGRALVVFIGHGAPSPGGDDGVLLGVDTQPEADSLAARGLTQGAVAAILAKGKQRETVLVYDACFSGKTADDAAPLVKGLQATLPVRRKSSTPSTLVLSSSESFAGPLPGGNRPAFSYLMLGALRGWADADHDKSVTVDEAFAFTEGTLRAALKQSNRMPKRQGGAGGAVLAKSLEDEPDVNAILVGRCPEGTKWGARRCETVACPAGMRWDGAACAATAAAIACPAGTTWNGVKCATGDVACPAGTSWNGSGCASSKVTCPGGARWNGDRCVDAAPDAKIARVEVPAPRPVPATGAAVAPGDACAKMRALADLNVYDDAAGPTTYADWLVALQCHARGASTEKRVAAARSAYRAAPSVDVWRADLSAIHAANAHAHAKPDVGFFDGLFGADADHDGVPDSVDWCKNDPEDKDGFADDDGCPEPDNDFDGVPDDKDGCPLAPAELSNTDGCPENMASRFPKPSAPDDGKPDWVHRGTAAVWDHTDPQAPQIHGVGVARGIRNAALRRTEADTRARAAIQALLKQFTFALAGAMGKPVDDRVVADAAAAAPIVDHYVEDDGTEYALARLDAAGTVLMRATDSSAEAVGLLEAAMGP